MNEKKAKIGMNATFIVGLIFSIIGAIFLVLGIVLFTGLKEEMTDAFMFLFIFSGIGLILFLIGILFLMIQLSKKEMSQRLLENGNYVVAEIFDITQEYNVTVNGRHPFVINCKYEAMDGTVHIFKSRYLYYNPESLLKNNAVRVYVDNNNYKKYYVDIDEVLPKVENH